MIACDEGLLSAYPFGRPRWHIEPSSIATAAFELATDHVRRLLRNRLYLYCWRQSLGKYLSLRLSSVVDVSSSSRAPSRQGAILQVDLDLALPMEGY